MSTVGTMVTVPIQLYSLPSYEKPERPMQVIEVQGDRYGDWLCHRDIWTSGSEEHTRWEYGECWTVAYIPSGRTLARMLSEAAAREIAHVMALGAHPDLCQRYGAIPGLCHADHPRGAGAQSLTVRSRPRGR